MKIKLKEIRKKIRIDTGMAFVDVEDKKYGWSTKIDNGIQPALLRCLELSIDLNRTISLVWEIVYENGDYKFITIAKVDYSKWKR